VEQVAIDVLEAAKELGRVILVTNSTRPWVNNSANNFAPDTLEPLLARPVVDIAYALECMEPMNYETAKTRADRDTYERRYYTTAKEKTIKPFIEEHFAKGEIWNVLSIGDGVFERDATQTLRNPYLKARRSDSIKTVKMMEDPNPEQLSAQLQIILAALPGMVAHGVNFDISLEDPERMEIQLRKFLNP
jgi:hypothetical protein